MRRETCAWRAAAVMAVALFGTVAGSGSTTASEPEDYDELPDGPAREVAPLYYSALALPGVLDWNLVERSALLDAATLRYRDRLVDRAPWASEASALRHIERLASSEVASAAAVAQACARYGLPAGPCAAHQGYVRRVLVVEEMLVQGQLTLAELEVELVGASRPRLSDAQ